MNTCENCIHKDLCKDMHKFGVVDLPYNDSGTCEHHKTEDNALHTLRLIYADFTANSKRNRERADRHSRFGEAESAFELRRVSEIQASDASRVRFWCRKIGFDPSANG